MMKLIARSWLLAGLLAMGAAAPAQAGVNLSLFAVGNAADISFDNDDTFDFDDRKVGFGGGASLELELSNYWGLDIGATYLQRRLGGVGDDDYVRFNYIQVPVLLRYWFSPFLTFAAGGYYAFGTGDVTTRIGDTTASVDFGSFPGSAIEDQDYGVMGAVGLNLPFGGTTSLMVEGRYTLGLADVLGVGGDRGRWNDIQGVVGLRFK